MPPWSGWGQEIELCSNVQNVSFSQDKKVDAVQTCTINVWKILSLNMLWKIEREYDQPENDERQSLFMYM